jgi:hypothetical protein
MMMSVLLPSLSSWRRRRCDAALSIVPPLPEPMTPFGA